MDSKEIQSSSGIDNKNSKIIKNEAKDPTQPIPVGIRETTEKNKIEEVKKGDSNSKELSNPISSSFNKTSNSISNSRAQIKMRLTQSNFKPLTQDEITQIKEEKGFFPLSSTPEENCEFQDNPNNGK